MNIKNLSFILLLFSLSTYAKNSPESLTAKLQEMADASKKKHPAERLKIMDDATEELRKSQILSKALKVGDKMPDFLLKDAKSKKVSSKDLLKKGRL